MVEDTELVSSAAPSDGSGISDEKEVKTLAQVDKGENVRMPGSDVKAGDLVSSGSQQFHKQASRTDYIQVISRGTLVTALGGEIGAIAFVGKREVRRLLHRLLHRDVDLTFPGTSSQEANRCASEYRKRAQ